MTALKPGTGDTLLYRGRILTVIPDLELVWILDARTGTRQLLDLVRTRGCCVAPCGPTGPPGAGTTSNGNLAVTIEVRPRTRGVHLDAAYGGHQIPQGGPGMTATKKIAITSCLELNPGDEVEATYQAVLVHRGRFPEVAPDHGLFWITDNLTGGRRLLDMAELDINRFQATPSAQATTAAA